MTIKRLDRLLTTSFFGNLPRLGMFSKQIPVLMYHSISSHYQKHAHPYFKTNTEPSVFYKQMAYLKRNDYRVISVDEALRIVNNGKQLQNKYTVITFDDGFQDLLTSALPILREFDFTATVYLPTLYIGENGRFFKNIRCLNWSEVAELQTNNIKIGSHTATHPKLISLTQKEVEYEITSSKMVIEDKLGKSCDSFSYPYAFPEENRQFVRVLRKVLVDSDYRNSVSTIIGTMEPNTDAHFIKRVPVNSDDDECFFKAKLEGAYNWIHLPQLLFKYAKSIR